MSGLLAATFVDRFERRRLLLIMFALFGLATLAGFIITQDAGGEIVDYGTVGYVAMAANVLAIWFVARIAMHDPHAVVPDAAPK